MHRLVKYLHKMFVVCANFALENSVVNEQAADYIFDVCRFDCKMSCIHLVLKNLNPKTYTTNKRYAWVK